MRGNRSQRPNPRPHTPQTGPIARHGVCPGTHELDRAVTKDVYVGAGCEEQVDHLGDVLVVLCRIVPHERNLSASEAAAWMRGSERNKLLLQLDDA